MQRISVDLPEPEGPQMTIFSPLATVRLMFLRTWKAPNHLLTPAIWIAGLRSPWLCAVSARAARAPSMCSSAMLEYAGGR